MSRSWHIESTGLLPHHSSAPSVPSGEADVAGMAARAKFISSTFASASSSEISAGHAGDAALHRRVGAKETEAQQVVAPLVPAHV